MANSLQSTSQTVRTGRVTWPCCWPCYLAVYDSYIAGRRLTPSESLAPRRTDEHRRRARSRVLPCRRRPSDRRSRLIPRDAPSRPSGSFHDERADEVWRGRRAALHDRASRASHVQHRRRDQARARGGHRGYRRHLLAQHVSVLRIVASPDAHQIGPIPRNDGTVAAAPKYPTAMTSRPRTHR